MNRRRILGLAAGAALVATVLAFFAGNMPLALVFLLFLLLSNTLESELVSYNSLVWVVYAAVTIQLASETTLDRGLAGHRPRVATGVVATPG